MAKGYVGIPMSYTPVEYIESDGNQYINTGVSPNSNIHCVLDFQFPTTPTAGGAIIGGWDSSKGMLFGVYSGNFRFAFGTSVWAGTAVAADANRHTLYMNDENGDGKLDNTVLASHTNVVSLTNTARTIYIFGSSGLASMLGCKVFSCKIYSGTALIRDYIPAVDNNNIACMYETVEGKLYYNFGSGTFTVGSTTGQPVSLGDRARRTRKGYVGINGVAKRIKKGYVGDSNGIARLCFQGKGGIPSYYTAVGGEATQKYWSAIVGTKDYVLEIGGGATSGASPVKTAKAYNANGVATSATDLPTQAWWSAAVKFNGLAIVAGGKSANSGSYRTDQCIAYNNNLTRQTLPTISVSVFSPGGAATSSHFFIAGGSNYSSFQTRINSYNSSLVKSTPTDMSATRVIGNFASVGNYIVCCGGFTYTGAVDFYDNSNVRTTSTDPYGKITQYPLGLSTNSYAVFFGGSTSSTAATAYTDCKAYDSNKVLTSFNLPMAAWGAQGFSNGNYAVVCYQANELVYDDNLVLVSHTIAKDFVSGQAYYGSTADDFAVVKKHTTTELNLFDI